MPFENSRPSFETEIDTFPTNPWGETWHLTSVEEDASEAGTSCDPNLQVRPVPAAKSVPDSVTIKADEAVVAAGAMLTSRGEVVYT